MDHMAVLFLVFKGLSILFSIVAVSVGGGRGVQEGGNHVYLWLIHVDMRQKLTQYHKATILQLKT